MYDLLDRIGSRIVNWLRPHVWIQQVDINGKYILMFDYRLTDRESVRVTEMIEDWLKDSNRHFLVLSDSVTLKKVK